MLDILVVLPSGTIERSPLLNRYAGGVGVLRTQTMGETRRLTLVAHPEPEGYVTDLPNAERTLLNDTALESWRTIKGSSESSALLIIGHPSPLSGRDNGIAMLEAKQYYSWFSHGDEDSRDFLSPLAAFLANPDDVAWAAILCWCWSRSSDSPYVMLGLLASALDPYRSFAAWKVRIVAGREALRMIAEQFGGQLAETARTLGDRLDAIITAGAWPEAQLLADLKRELVLVQRGCRTPRDEWF